MNDRLGRIAIAIAPAWIVVWWSHLKWATGTMAVETLRIIVYLAFVWSIILVHAIWRRR